MIKTLIYFFKGIDYILVPPHDFVEQSTWWRVKNMYLPGLILKRKIGNIIPLLWFLSTLIFSPIFTIIYIILNKFKPFKILKIDLSQIGTVAYLPVIVGWLNKNNNKNKIIVSLPYITMKQNNFIFDYLSADLFKNFFFVKNIFLRFFLTSASWYSKSTINSNEFECFRDSSFSEFAYEMGKTIEFDINEKIDNRNLEKTRVEFLKFCGEKGLVTFNLRSPLFYEESRKSIRNVSAINYAKTISHLHKLGYSICFTHSPGNQLLEFMQTQNIDYRIFGERSFKGQFENLLSLIGCKYLIGSSTGASAIPLLKDIPVLWTNSHIPFQVPCKKNDVVIWKKFLLPSGQILSYEDYLNLEIDIPSVQGKIIKKLSIKVVENTEEEIFQSLLLFLDLQDKSIDRKATIEKYKASSVIDNKNCLQNKWSKFSNAMYIKSFGEK